ncbi:hypothetical protein Syun_019940 [Stephania yunnanensis]|uniref:Alcohol dehydrogenase-like C-terminal domain-containing protein n=1 Tax=Stephania yunnanensis TaxID=152371 RepID=A0AAP0IV37_9MAGN
MKGSFGEFEPLGSVPNGISSVIDVPFAYVLAATKEMKSFPIIGDLLNFFFYVYITFAEYTVVDSACAVKLSPDVPLEKMSLLSCGVSTGLGAAWNTANVKPGSTLAIFGLGAVGLALIVYVSQCRQGVTEFINPKELDTPLHEKIREMTQGGVDYSFECAGNLDVLREAFLSTHDVVNLDGFITHELPFSKINEAFKLLGNGESMRCLLTL